MMNGKLGVLAVAICVAIGAALYAFAQGQSHTATAPREGQLTGDVLLVNLKTMEVAFILKDYELVTIGGKVFLRGTMANIGDGGPKRAGLIADLALEDITVIREFSWTQAKSYYGNLFREEH